MPSELYLSNPALGFPMQRNRACGKTADTATIDAYQVKVLGVQ